MIKRKEDVRVVKVHLKDLLQILENVWENKKVAVSVDDLNDYFYFNDVFNEINCDEVIDTIQVLLTFVHL